MAMINSHECPPPMEDCIYKVLPLELPKKESSVPQKNKCGTKKHWCSHNVCQRANASRTPRILYNCFLREMVLHSLSRVSSINYGSFGA